MPMCKHITVNGSSHEIVALVSSVAPLGAGQAMTARVISRLESGHGGLVRGGSIHAMAILGSWWADPCRLSILVGHQFSRQLD